MGRQGSVAGAIPSFSKSKIWMVVPKPRTLNPCRVVSKWSRSFVEVSWIPQFGENLDMEGGQTYCLFAYLGLVGKKGTNIYVYMYIYMHIYIYRERERERV